MTEVKLLEISGIVENILAGQNELQISYRQMPMTDNEKEELMSLLKQIAEIVSKAFYRQLIELSNE